MQTLAKYDFLIWVSYEDWMAMSPTKRKALIDHELCHCQYDSDERKATVRPHDIEEFAEIIERYGFWSVGLQDAAPAIEKARQMSLPGTTRSGEVVAASPVEVNALM